jgi:hypothetical protein
MLPGRHQRRRSQRLGDDVVVLATGVAERVAQRPYWRQRRGRCRGRRRPSRLWGASSRFRDFRVEWIRRRRIDARCAALTVTRSSSLIRSRAARLEGSGSAAIFVDQSTQHVDPLHRRPGGDRFDQRQPGNGTRRAADLGCGGAVPCCSAVDTPSTPGATGRRSRSTSSPDTPTVPRPPTARRRRSRTAPAVGSSPPRCPPP